MTEFLDLGLLRGIITAVLLVAFCAMVIWTYSSRRSPEFSKAAQMALDDSDLDQPLPLKNGEIEGNGQ